MSQSVSGVVVDPKGNPVNHVLVLAYPLRLCPGGVLPVMNGPGPAPGYTAPSVVTGPAYGAPGAYTIALPTAEPFALCFQQAGVSYWSLANNVPFNDTVSGFSLTGKVAEKGTLTKAITSGTLPALPGGSFIGPYTRDVTLTLIMTTTGVGQGVFLFLSPDGQTYSPNTAVGFEWIPNVAATIVSSISIPLPAGFRLQIQIVSSTGVGVVY